MYHAMGSKSIESLKELGFLKRYAGILVHDHETALYHFGADHAGCNVHIICYLRKNTEETGNAWSREMLSLLCGMCSIMTIAETLKKRNMGMIENIKKLFMGTLSIF